jgi:hypothetical protein
MLEKKAPLGTEPPEEAPQPHFLTMPKQIPDL